jgi:hypothetical protein
MSVVVDNTAAPSAAFGKFRRVLLVAIGVGLIVLLVVARSLEPSREGFGTHQQLGLPPCTFTALFHMRCPSCGMTTSWSHLTRGRFDRAAQSNVGGVLLGVIAMMAAPWLLVSALRGKWFVWAPSDRWVLAIAGAITVITLLDWGWRLWRG